MYLTTGSVMKQSQRARDAKNMAKLARATRDSRMLAFATRPKESRKRGTLHLSHCVCYGKLTYINNISSPSYVWNQPITAKYPPLLPKIKTAVRPAKCVKQIQISGSGNPKTSPSYLSTDFKLFGPLHRQRVAAWDDVLSQLFFEQNIMSVGWYAFLPQLYYQALPHTGLRQAVLAASYFLAANQLKDPGILRLAQLKYGLALRLVSSAIAGVRALDDDTLASILVLNIVDDITGQSNLSLNSHLNGCAELVKLRSATPSRTARSVDLVHSVMIQMQPSLIQGHELPAASINDSCTGEWLWQEVKPPPSITVSTLSAKIGQLSKKTKQLLSRFADDGQVCSSLTALLEDGMVLEESMLQWSGQQKARWEIKATEVMGSSVHFYADIQVAKVWNHWRVARIILHSTLLAIIEHLDQQPAGLEAGLRSAHDESLTIVQEMLSDISASIPYHIHEIDEKGRRSNQIQQRVLGGRALMWPLKMILDCKWSAPSQRGDAVETLHLISDGFGIKQAAVFLREALERQD